MQAGVDVSEPKATSFNYWLKISLCVFLALWITACSDKVYYEEFQAIEQEQWNMNAIKSFRFHIQDTSSSYRLIYTIRNTTDYPYSNFYVFTTTTHPGHEAVRDTIECMLADKYGKWLGTGFGKIRESRFLIREQFGFPDTGEYVIDIEHGMRDEVLRGITDVGVRLEKITIPK